MNTKTNIKAAVEHILTGVGQLEAFRTSKHYSVKIENAPFMSLSIERHGELITVTHYYEQKGDLVPDPDMEFLEHGGDWIPIAIQHATGHYVRAGDCENGVWKFDAKRTRELQTFAKLWGRNLVAQGFDRGSIALAKAV